MSPRTLTSFLSMSLGALFLQSCYSVGPRAGYSAGLPADLLRARPDIRKAERVLAARTARVGVAVADLYPRFTLFGDFSLQAVNSGDLFDSASVDVAEQAKVAVEDAAPEPSRENSEVSVT